MMKDKKLHKKAPQIWGAFFMILINQSTGPYLAT